MTEAPTRKRGPRPRPPIQAIPLEAAVAAASLGARRLARWNDLQQVEGLANDAPLAVLTALPAVRAALEGGEAMPLSRGGLVTALRAELVDLDQQLRALGVEPPALETEAPHAG